MVRGWQPIETAPKDGTFVLLAGGETNEDFYRDSDKPECRKRPVSAFFWCFGLYCDFEEEGAWFTTFWDGDWRSLYNNPTHWMPLPEIPE